MAKLLTLSERGLAGIRTYTMEQIYRDGGEIFMQDGEFIEAKILARPRPPKRTGLFTRSKKLYPYNAMVSPA